MTADEKRSAVIEAYDIILGRNLYSQPRRDYCYRRYQDGKYYSDCSSSISYAYKEAGFGFGILNTVGMFQSAKFSDVPVEIKNGIIRNPEVLRRGDLLLFAGTDTSRAYAKYVGHVEMVYSTTNGQYMICGHGSGTPSTKDMNSYCRSRYGASTKTKIGNKGLICVKRYIQDDESEPPKHMTDDVVRITGGSVNIRTGPGTEYASIGIAHRGDEFHKPDCSGWQMIRYRDNVCWISEKYIKDGVCTGGSVNVRTGPGTAYQSIGIVHKGEELGMPIVGDWICIIHDNAVRWVSGKYAR